MAKYVVLQQSMKMLVGITSYGRANDLYLEHIVKEYRSMAFACDIVVFSNIEKTVPAGVQLIVGLPTKNPWSLPFAHKGPLAERVLSYDVFVYSEDDILITDRNIRAFLHLQSLLPENEIPGFLRFEMAADGKKRFPEFHVNYRWEPGSVRSYADFATAFCTNEHAGCYILTRSQLQRAIASGGFVVPPHQGKYDWACSAATDPYTQCGLRKVICISHLEDFLVHHLPNKYVDSYGLRENDLLEYVKALRETQSVTTDTVIRTDSFSIAGAFSKDYYEQVREDLIALIPPDTRSVLSVGCGWGRTESRLAEMGFDVAVLPLDPVMATWARAKGLNVIVDLPERLETGHCVSQFDCLLCLDILHLCDNPAQWLSYYVQALTPNGVAILEIPSLPKMKVVWKMIRNRAQFHGLGSHRRSGVHTPSPRVVRRWLRAAGMTPERWYFAPSKKCRWVGDGGVRILQSMIASKMTVIARCIGRCATLQSGSEVARSGGRTAE